MLFRYHGEPTTAASAKSLPKAMPGDPPSVGYMFGALADDPANRLPEGRETIAALRLLGASIAAEPSSANSLIPAAYTYFGQFIDHDITKTEFDGSLTGNGVTDPIEPPAFRPLRPDEVRRLVTNARKPALDLDSLYFGLAELAQRPDGRMVLGVVSASNDPIATADKNHDLPRRPKIANPVTFEDRELDRQALIGDPRNDENLLVAQLHVAFLRTHNALMDRGLDREAARRALRRRYQWAVLHDFLPRVCDPAIVRAVVQEGRSRWAVGTPADLFMPLEFSAAAYRFGHSMIRPGYNHNRVFSREPFINFFTFTALSGNIHPSQAPGIEFPTLPDNWIIDWPRFFSSPGDENQPGLNPARAIDTQITPPLGALPDILGEVVCGMMGKLAARNLLRGYLLGLPTGQAVAQHLGLPALAADVIKAAIPVDDQAAMEQAGLIARTPLWFYILAEAGDPSGPKGQHLGPVGSTIVAETLWNLARHADDSVVGDPPSQAELDTGEFTLKGLIRIGQDRGMEQLA